MLTFAYKRKLCTLAAPFALSFLAQVTLAQCVLPPSPPVARAQVALACAECPFPWPSASCAQVALAQCVLPLGVGGVVVLPAALGVQLA